VYTPGAKRQEPCLWENDLLFTRGKIFCDPEGGIDYQESFWQAELKITPTQNPFRYAYQINIKMRVCPKRILYRKRSRKLPVSL
jgi:hypothetical protein